MCIDEKMSVELINAAHYCFPIFEIIQTNVGENSEFR